MEIRWPHALRVDYKLNYFLELDWDKLTPLELSSEETRTIVEVAPVIDNKPDLNKLTELDLKKIGDEKRFQTVKLQAAVRLRERFAKNWDGDPASHISQLLGMITALLVFPASMILRMIGVVFHLLFNKSFMRLENY